MTIEEIVRQSIDLHYHIGPEIIPRKYGSVDDFIKKMNGKIKGAVIKNHFYPTSAFIKEAKDLKKMKIVGSVVLNNFVGGLNSEAVYGASIISNTPIVVWFPTIHALNSLKQSKIEIPTEWVKKKDFRTRSSKLIKGISVLDSNGKLVREAKEVLVVIKKTNSILATGHISVKETEKLVKKAREIDIKKIIITHPIYQKINMPINSQKKYADMGCYIEVPYSMFSIDNIPITKIASQVKAINSSQVIISSDVGQIFSLDPDVALKKFAQLLIKQGITLDMLYQMMVINSRKLLNI